MRATLSSRLDLLLMSSFFLKRLYSSFFNLVFNLVFILVFILVFRFAVDHVLRGFQRFKVEGLFVKVEGLFVKVEGLFVKVEGLFVKVEN